MFLRSALVPSWFKTPLYSNQALAESLVCGMEKFWVIRAELKTADYPQIRVTSHRIYPARTQG